jgi:hypothetical protein
MAFRVDRVVFDPASGAQPGGVQIYQQPSMPMPWQPRPFTTKTEYQVSEAMRLMTVPAEVIRNQIPPVPYQLFPPVVGYDDTPLTIQDVLQTDRWSPQRRSWVSGTPRYPRQVDQIEDQWSGTLRGFNSSPNIAG